MYSSDAETNEQRSFGPEDSDKHTEERTRANVIPTDREEISSSVERQTSEERNATREKAVKAINEIPNKNEAVFLKVKEAVENDKSKEDIMNILIGYSAQILSDSLLPEDCRVVYKSPNIKTIPNINIPAADYLDSKYGIPPRKDLALIADFFNTEAPKINPKDQQKALTQEQIEQTKKDILHVLTNYKQISTEWQRQNMSAKQHPHREQLIRWYIEHENHKPKGAAGKTQNIMIDEAFKYISDSDKEMDKSILTNFHDPVYVETTIPTSFLADKKGYVFGAIEMNAYTKGEVRALINTLQKVYKLTARDETSWVFSDRVPELESYNLRGMQVKIPPDYEDKTIAGMRLGLNITGIRNFITIANHPEKGKFEYDMIDPKTAEVTHLTEPLIVWRLPDNIPDEDIEKLGSLAAKLGYGNLIIQKLPFSRDDIKTLSHALFYKTFSMDKNDATDAVRNKNNKTKEMFSQLANRDTWLNPEKK